MCFMFGLATAGCHLAQQAQHSHVMAVSCTSAGSLCYICSAADWVDVRKLFKPFLYVEHSNCRNPVVR